jgi:hypothetical protein
MHINQLRESKFLKKEDCGRGVLVTIKGLIQEDVAMEGEPSELKWCLQFNETAKPMSLNSTNAQIIAQITGSEDTDHWPGHRIVLYNDPTISFKGKIIGGIRVRAPKAQAVAPTVNAPVQSTPPVAMPHVNRGTVAPATPAAEDDSDMPF